GGPIWDSTAALSLPSVPRRLLVVGGGYIGLELSTVYAALGAEVTVVELTEGLLPGVDRDLVAPLARRLGPELKSIHLRARVTAATAQEDGCVVELEGDGAPGRVEVERVLVAVGRRPNTGDLGLEHVGVTLDPRGFVPVDQKRQTANSHVYAIG